jgi:integrase
VAKRRAKGEGSLYFNDKIDRWIAQITLPNGKRRSKSGKTQGEVRDWLIEQRNKSREGLYVADDKLRLGEFLDDFMENVAKHSLRPRSYQRSRELVDYHIKPALGNVKLSSLDPRRVQAFYSSKLDKGLSKRTVQYIHSVLHRSLEQALRWGLVNRNVTDLVDKPKPDKKPVKTWSADEVNRFLRAVEDHRWYPIYILAVYTGMRQGELLGLHKSDVDLDKGVIHVKHQLSEIRGVGLVITEPKTERSRRPITLPATALQVLKNHLTDFEGSLLFTTSTGNPIRASNIVQHLKKVTEEEGLPKIRFHDLRHTHATLLLMAGTHPRVVQERLGHSSISMTLDVYSHVIPSMQDEAAEQFEAILA